MGDYRTIVADPPWHYPKRPGNFEHRKYGKGEAPAAPDVSLPYPTMSVEEICALDVGGLAATDAHLYLWTTQRFLRDAYTVLDAWGFTQSAVLVWCKPPMGIVGTYVCSTEFCIFARRGKLAGKKRHMGTAFNWPRGKHSQKPEAFQDIVEQVSPGPYLELFARRQRLGWDVWGNEVDSAVEMPEVA